MRVVPPPDQRDGPVARALQVGHEHELLEVPDMKAFSRGIEPDVEGDALGIEELPQSLLVGALADESPFFERVEHPAHADFPPGAPPAGRLYSVMALRTVEAISVIFTRTCSMESRNRMVTVWSSLVW